MNPQLTQVLGSRAALYNDNDRYCCDWLQNLMDAGLITPGRIDDRSIADLTPDDVRGYQRCHFFAGLGGWELALKLAGWPDDRPVWTGSCPCQPFSNAGQRKGHGEERHLWPALSALIRVGKPAIFFGEQVKSAIGFGWLDAVAADLEAQAYSFGAAVLPACAVSAPHERSRVWFVAHPNWKGELAKPIDAEMDTTSEPVAHAVHDRSGDCDEHRDVAHASSPRSRPGLCESRTQQNGNGFASTGWWESEPAVGRVAHGIPARVAKLRALGNAIVPQVAAEFIKAVL